MTVDRVRDCARVDGVECVGGKVRVWDRTGRRQAGGKGSGAGVAD